MVILQILTNEKGQTYTLESVAAAIIMILVLSIVVQTSSLTPLSSSFTNQHVKLELQNLGNDILRTLDETPAIYSTSTTGINETNTNVPSLLKRSVIDWAVFSYYDIYTWNGTTLINQTNRSSITQLNTSLSNTLNFALTNNSIAYNVEVSYPDVNGTINTTKMIWNGDPSENSVIVSRFIVLRNNPYEIPPGNKSDNCSYLVMQDVGKGTNLHTIVEVRLTLWVM